VWLRIRVSGLGGGWLTLCVFLGVGVWGCFIGPFFVWRIFLSPFGVVLVLSSY